MTVFLNEATRAVTVVGRRSRLLYFIPTIFLIPLLLVMLNSPQSFIGYSMTAIFFLHLVARNRPSEWLLAVLVGALLNQCARLVSLPLHLPARAPNFSLAMLGAGSVIVLGCGVLVAKDAEVVALQQTCLTAVVLFTLVLDSQLMLGSAGMRRPATLDSYLQAFDLSLVWPSPFFVGRWLKKIRYARFVAQITYSILPIAVAVVCGGYIRYRKVGPWHFLTTMAIAGILGYACYLLFPAAGPAYVSEFRFPTISCCLSDFAHGVARPLFVPLDDVRNAMPSLHVAWALLIWFNSKQLPRAFRVFSLVYVVMTVIVVLGLGEHYLADLIVAVPFSVLVQAVSVDKAGAAPARWRAILGSALIVALWLLLLRYGTMMFVASPIIPWTCVLVSTPVSIGLLLPLLNRRPPEYSSSRILPSRR